MRARRKPWTEKELASNERIIDNAEAYKGKWNEYFSNNNPIHIEIGCGKGRFITQTAEKNANINYIAIEREPHVIVTGARNSRELSCHLAFIVGDVKNLLLYFEPKEISRIYINFCDPWQNRKKWHKRRLTHESFLNLYRELFGKEKGEIHFKTDNQELFEFSLNQFSNNNWRLRNISLDLHNSNYEGNIMTEYEEKFSNKGMPIFRCEAYYEL